MSWLVRQKSQAHRLRDDGKITAERFGRLHEGSPMLEWGSITKTVTARITEQLEHAGALHLSAPVSEYLPDVKLPEAVDVHSLVSRTFGLPRLPEGIITNLAELRDPYAKYTTAVLSFLGFDGNATMAEESTGGRRSAGRAMITALFGLATLFISQTWLASVLVNGTVAPHTIRSARHCTISSRRHPIRAGRSPSSHASSWAPAWRMPWRRRQRP